jgi:hypothetical protein
MASMWASSALARRVKDHVQVLVGIGDGAQQIILGGSVADDDLVG